MPVQPVLSSPLPAASPQRSVSPSDFLGLASSETVSGVDFEALISRRNESSPASTSPRQAAKKAPPESNRPEANRPEANRPEANRPEANRPEANRPEANRPEANRESNQPASAQAVKDSATAKDAFLTETKEPEAAEKPLAQRSMQQRSTQTQVPSDDAPSSSQESADLLAIAPFADSVPSLVALAAEIAAPVLKTAPLPDENAPAVVVAPATANNAPDPVFTPQAPTLTAPFSSPFIPTSFVPTPVIPTPVVPTDDSHIDSVSPRLQTEGKTASLAPVAPAPAPAPAAPPSPPVAEAASPNLQPATPLSNQAAQTANIPLPQQSATQPQQETSETVSDSSPAPDPLKPDPLKSEIKPQTEKSQSGLTTSAANTPPNKSASGVSTPEEAVIDSAPANNAQAAPQSAAQPQATSLLAEANKDTQSAVTASQIAILADNATTPLRPGRNSEDKSSQARSLSSAIDKMRGLSDMPSATTVINARALAATITELLAESADIAGSAADFDSVDFNRELTQRIVKEEEVSLSSPIAVQHSLGRSEQASAPSAPMASPLAQRTPPPAVQQVTVHLRKAAEEGGGRVSISMRAQRIWVGLASIWILDMKEGF